MLLTFIAFFVLFLLGMPVVFAIGISSLVFFLQHPELPLTILVQLILSQTQNFALLAIPTFILAGNLMNEMGVTERLLAFARVVMGHYRGGLAQVSTLFGALMGGASGSAIAEASTLARILGPEMVHRGYTPGFVAALQGFVSLLAVALPPSIGLILYGTLGQVSIGQLFAGGIGMGLLLLLTYILTVAIVAQMRSYSPETARAPRLLDIGKALLSSLWSLLYVIFVPLSLRLGLFVPSEIGAGASLYALAVGGIHRAFSVKRIKRAFSRTVEDMAPIAFLIAIATLFSYGMTWEGIPPSLARIILSLEIQPQLILAFILVFLFLLGTFMDSTVMIILLTPILVPVIKELGIDPVYFGVLMVLTCAAGLLTPPVGLAMYAVCSVMGCRLEDFLRESWPFFLAFFIAMLLAYFFPILIQLWPQILFG